ncbi:MAG: aminotransferase class III-fold pyridoxal phosphate-dependent enzyme [Gammaproteobacteria bacterium]|nr:aminotransferase class III-fold pyridoxal phosphate-dependent enzyme [Gammaproteobacteria bacterium]
MSVTAQPSDGLSQDDLYAAAENALPGAGLGGYSLPEDVRFVIAEARGARLISADGREYVDYVGGAGANIVGANHPQVVAAVQAQATKGLHFFGTLNSTAIRLAERLIELIPCAEKLVFTTTGSEATAYAMRMARAFTGRERILKFEGAYHGNHDYASFSQFPAGPANYPLASADSGGVPMPLQSTMLVAPYNDLEVVESVVREHSSELAAIIVEPVQRVIFPDDGFLAGLRRIADQNHVLLIFDEVVTGFRLALGGAQEYFGVRPDLASYGKIVGGGGPLGAVAGREDIVELTNPRNKGNSDYAYINGTFHGNPVAAAAALATLDVLSEPGFHRRLNARAKRFYGDMQSVLQRHAIPAMVTGHASFWQFLFAGQAPRSQLDVLASDLERSKALDLELLRCGVYVLPNVRRFVSAVHTDEDLRFTLAALDAACEQLNRSINNG